MAETDTILSCFCKQNLVLLHGNFQGASTRLELLGNILDSLDLLSSQSILQRSGVDGVSGDASGADNAFLDAPGLIGGIQAAIQEACKEKTERDRRRGIKNRPIRAMVVGIPNVGKSTFINTFAGRACAKTGNKPGVTKGKQWIRLNKNVELLDTPGILWPKFEDEEVGMRLAYIGSIKDDILNLEELSLTLIDFLREKYAGALEKRYQIAEEGTAVQVLEAIARSRGCLKKGEELDYAKASLILFDDFRSGKIGRITLEWVPQEEK